MTKEEILAMEGGKELSEGEIEALIDEEAKQGCEYGTYADGEDKVFTPKGGNDDDHYTRGDNRYRRVGGS